jgi:hypothetical protein
MMIVFNYTQDIFIMDYISPFLCPGTMSLLASRQGTSLPARWYLASTQHLNHSGVGNADHDHVE